MILALAVYGLTFSSVGLLTLLLAPVATRRTQRYFVRRLDQTNERFSEMFIEVARPRLLLLHVGVPAVGLVLGGLLLGNAFGPLVGLALGLLVPRLVVNVISWKHRRKSQHQLVDMLLVMSSSLKAGLNLLQSLEVVSEELPPPLSREISLMLKEMRMGLGLDETLKRFRKRVSLDDLNLVVTTLLVARETGGDVTRLFARLIDTLRERQKLKERILTLTVIPRLQGWLMACLPMAFIGTALQVNPRYFDPLFQDSVGNIVGLGAVGCWVVSLFLIFRFSKSPTT